MKTVRRAPSVRGEELFEAEWQRTPSALAASDLFSRIISRGPTTSTLSDVVALMGESSSSRWRIRDGHFDFSVGLPAQWPQLPREYGLKGGAARHLLAQSLNRAALLPRDFDLVRYGTGWLREDEEAARLFMPNDYVHGAKVEVVRSIDDYFASRDMTLNEVIWHDGTLSCSAFALLDFVASTIRPTKYRPGTLKREPSLPGRTLLKMIRIRSELAAAGENWRLLGVPEHVEYTDFDLALQLDKAYQIDDGLASSFLESCVIAGMLDHEPDRLVDQVLAELEHLTIGERAVLRHHEKPR